METSSSNNELGELLRELRLAKSWSVRKAGEESGISYPSISNFENGIHSSSKNPIKPSPEQLKKLAAAYNYPYNLLMIKAGYGEFVENKHSELNVTELMNALQASIDATEPYTATDTNSDEYFDSLKDFTLHEPIKEWETVSKTINETIGERITLVRVLYGVSINRLSNEMTGIIKHKNYLTHRKFPPLYIQSIEDGHEDPEASFMIGFSEYFDISLEWLMTGKGHAGYKVENSNKDLVIDTNREEFKNQFKDITMKVIMENMDTIIKEAEHRAKMKKPPY
ncbi:helix-turn-helix transcriptional regulator [Paenibacillus sp. O199]|uniref:helix-turn-helix transcriptional regulator n=1 Tax=Paenibacillus sp. O199 TaxID=1643925 RepID=UPI0007BF3112|nr:helix-turn-helix transcriptional regulator [Paenibacillus sp. O199]